MYDICCIGHITLDKVVRPGSVIEMPGGTAYYFSNALRHMDLKYLLVTAIAGKEIRFVEQLASRGIEVKAFASELTVCFENIYEGHMDHRVQKVWQKSAAFNTQQLKGVNAAIFHLGPLLADDIPTGLIRDLSARGIVSLDVQGYLREVRDSDVHAIDWPLKEEILPYIDILKANEEEMRVLTGTGDIRKGASILAGWGVKEVIITKGSKGSVILFNGHFHEIPAYIKGTPVDATGCGDTYMAGYLYQRAKGIPPQRAGEFASAMAGLKVAARPVRRQQGGCAGTAGLGEIDLPYNSPKSTRNSFFCLIKRSRYRNTSRYVHMRKCRKCVPAWHWETRTVHFVPVRTIRAGLCLPLFRQSS